ncbi:MAG: chromate efflux transporter [Aquamicrobium sp.]|uniref:chromate efflux transporter n=1 Tax=Aquamicrobium sp. TaxID=1872579 RepID=UPI00349E872C|nr:chromate efflux transporter [Aquamicrobium sp.]
MNPGPAEPPETASGSQGAAGEVLVAFLKLGLTSFGGPIAHLGYFREEFVARRRWIDDRGYADLVALCQFLPGPASSQVGFALGLQRAGAKGALAAWVGFTLPSAILLVLFAWSAGAIAGPLGLGLLHGLKVAAVAIVAQAVWGMARALCPDRQRAGIAVAAVVIVTVLGGVSGQFAAILAGALAGLWLCRDESAGQGQDAGLHFPVSKAAGVAALAVFALLLVGLPLLAAAVPMQALAVVDAFYRAGALVFGGGHVVLPLLEAEIVAPGWVSADAFLAGYGAAQAVPGPLFTFAAFLGALLEPAPNGIAGAALALVAIFLPGLLLLTGALPFWSALRARPRIRAPMAGVNAAVVGILGAALYDPVWTAAIRRPEDFALALVCFAALTVWKSPPWIVVLIAAAGGAGLALLRSS